MALTDFTLSAGQRAERKKLITVAEWTEGATQVREILGARTPDSSIEYNPDITTETDILGINYTDVNKTQPQQDFDPYLILGGSKLGFKLSDIRRRNALSEMSQFTVYIIEAYLDDFTGSYESIVHAYSAEKHTGCTIAFNSLGGDVNVNFPISVYFSNNKILGTVDKLTSDFVFTQDV